MNIGPDEWLAGVGTIFHTTAATVFRASFLGASIALFAPISALVTDSLSSTFSISAVLGLFLAPLVYSCTVYVLGITLVYGLGWNRSLIRVLIGIFLGTLGCAMLPVTKAAILFVSMTIDGLNWFAVAVSVHEVVFGAVDWRLGVVSYALIATSSLVLQDQISLGGTKMVLEAGKQQSYVLTGICGVCGVISWFFGALVVKITTWSVFTLVVTSVVASRYGR